MLIYMPLHVNTKFNYKARTINKKSNSIETVEKQQTHKISDVKNV